MDKDKDQEASVGPYLVMLSDMLLLKYKNALPFSWLTAKRPMSRKDIWINCHTSALLIQLNIIVPEKRERKDWGENVKSIWQWAFVPVEWSVWPQNNQVVALQTVPCRLEFTTFHQRLQSLQYRLPGVTCIFTYYQFISGCSGWVQMFMRAP